MQIKFISNPEISYLEDIKSLLFFNQSQRRVASGIVSSIEKYGLPQISIVNDKIVLGVGNLENVQSMFAIHSDIPEKPVAGIVIYFRSDMSNITVLHISVKEEYSFEGVYRDSFVALRLIAELKSIAKRIKGINSLTIYYHKDIAKNIKIR